MVACCASVAARRAEVTRCTCPTTRGFYLCPMQGRLRVAGTVELGGLRLPRSPHRIAKLVEGARVLFPDLPAPSRSWMGFRPSIPDSVPVISRSASKMASMLLPKVTIVVKIAAMVKNGAPSRTVPIRQPNKAKAPPI